VARARQPQHSKDFRGKVLQVIDQVKKLRVLSSTESTVADQVKAGSFVRELSKTEHLLSQLLEEVEYSGSQVESHELPTKKVSVLHGATGEYLGTMAGHESEAGRREGRVGGADTRSKSQTVKSKNIFLDSSEHGDHSSRDRPSPRFPAEPQNHRAPSWQPPLGQPKYDESEEASMDELPAEADFLGNLSVVVGRLQKMKASCELAYRKYMLIDRKVAKIKSYLEGRNPRREVSRLLEQFLANSVLETIAANVGRLAAREGAIQQKVMKELGALYREEQERARDLKKTLQVRRICLEDLLAATKLFSK
jgi:hypothetical protein